MDLQPAIERIGAYVAQRLGETRTPGLSLALTSRDELLHAQAWGVADALAGTPLTSAHLLEWGSIGKSFTAAVLLQLREEGRVDLDAPVTDYLPWFALRSRYAPIALHHLLTHTAGLSSGTEYTTDPRFEVWAARELHTAHAPGERHHYSNLGYKVLGVLLERLLDRPYAGIVEERILAPLGMRDTVATITHATRPRLATPHERLYDDRPSLPSHPVVPATWVETNSADGCIAGTAADLTAWLRLLLRRGATESVRILAEESFERMTRRWTRVSDTLAYGYGLRIRDAGDYTAIGHSGGMIGHYAHMEANVDDGVGVVALINGPGSAVGIARDALHVLTAATRGAPLPPLPPARDPYRVAGATDYAGTFQLPGQALRIVAGTERLWLEFDGERIPLISAGPDAFIADHPRFDRFLLAFGRAGERVVELFHGGDWYVREGQPRAVADYPAAWDACPGHYRTTNPWAPSFRVVLRQGRLMLLFDALPDGFTDAQELLPLDDGTFGVDDAGVIYDRLRFDAVVDGHALRAHLSTAPYYRFFTP